MNMIAFLISWFVLGSSEPEVTAEDFKIDWLNGWHSQYGQDQKIMKWFYSDGPASAWEAFSSGERVRQGVFVELGAGDGIDKSNSLAFEQKLGWTGLLIEPAPSLYQKLRQNRPKAKCVQACVAGSAGLKDFVEDGLNSGTTSRHLLSKPSTSLMCQSLGSLIDTHLAELGSHIDYLSLDVEGSELEILRSFNFQKHQIDVISIEIDETLPRIMYKRLSSLLRRNGYRFFERVVIDEIWVRQRGFHPDPSCSLRSVMLQKIPQFVPAIGWGGIRGVLWPVANVLKGELDQLGHFEQMAVEKLFALWSSGDLGHWEEQCPLGMLSLGLAYSLLRDRENESPDTFQHLITELKQQTIFYWNQRLASILDTVRHSDLVKQSELAAEDFQFRASLGKSWHLVSFEEVLESGWPFFRLLSVASKKVASIPQVLEYLRGSDAQVMRPVSMPRIRCQLRVFSQISLEQKLPAELEGKHKSIQHLLLNSDACNLLGTAASNFHHVRQEMQRLMFADKKTTRRFAQFDRLVNWTASCSEGPPLEPRFCHEKSMDECAALGDDSKAIPKRCLQLRESKESNAPNGLRLRRKFRFADHRISSWLDQGERLLRTFVERHGLFVALWSAGQSELAPFAAQAETEDRETMFDVLHSIQEQLFLLEGYPENPFT